MIEISREILPLAINELYHDNKRFIYSIDRAWYQATLLTKVFDPDLISVVIGYLTGTHTEVTVSKIHKITPIHNPTKYQTGATEKILTHLVVDEKKYKVSGIQYRP